MATSRTNFSPRAIARYLRHRTGSAETRFRFEKLLYHTKLRFRGGDDPVVVYTMGKVGSSTISRSLVDICGGNAVHHIHWLTPGALARDERRHRDQAIRYAGSEREREFFPFYVWRGQYLRSVLTRSREGSPPVRVITLVRDPVARNVSALFENLLMMFDYDNGTEVKARGIEAVKSDVIRLFLDHYVTGSDLIETDCDPLTWLDDELKQSLGVDVYQRPFPTDKGFEIYEAPGVRGLLLRMEDLRRCAETALTEFLELDEFEMKDANVASAKPYAGLYREVVKNLRPPDEYLDRLYGSKMARHFYTEDDLAVFRQKWTDDGGPVT